MAADWIYPCGWECGPAEVSLGAREVHVWGIQVSKVVAQAPSLWEMLSRFEQERAGQFYYRYLQQRYVVVHGTLRIVLGRYLQMAPADVSLARGAFGKPLVQQDDTLDRLEFSLSHCADLAVIAIARNTNLGVDIEERRDTLGWEQVIEHFLAPSERADLRVLPHASRFQAFYDTWVCKEAYVKARGVGLSLPLDQFAVRVLPAGLATLVYDIGCPDASRTWKLQLLDMGMEYSGAIALDAQGEAIRLRRWIY